MGIFGDGYHDGDNGYVNGDVIAYLVDGQMWCAKHFESVSEMPDSRLTLDTEHTPAHHGHTWLDEVNVCGEGHDIPTNHDREKLQSIVGVCQDTDCAECYPFDIDDVDFEFTKATPRSMPAVIWHEVTATVDGKQVGYVWWMHKTSRIHDIKVEPDYRRKGIATALWREAQRVALVTRGVKPPRHSPGRTDDGDAWARSLGERLPARGAEFAAFALNTGRPIGVWRG